MTRSQTSAHQPFISTEGAPKNFSTLAVIVIGVPLVLSFVYTWVGAGQLAQHLSRTGAFFYWAGLLVPKWIAMDLGCRIVTPVLRPWSPPVILVVFLGAILAAVSFRPLSLLYLDLFLSWEWVQQCLPTTFVFEGANISVPTSPPEFAQVILQNAVSIALWTSIALVCGRWMEQPNYAVWGQIKEDELKPVVSDKISGAPEQLTPERPSFMARAKLSNRASIRAIQAEDHYIRIFTDEGDDLVLFRFSDAVRDLADHDGLQIHRSFWVARNAIERVERAGKAYKVQLTGGHEIPLSRSYIALARTSGLID